MNETSLKTHLEILSYQIENNKKRADYFSNLQKSCKFHHPQLEKSEKLHRELAKALEKTLKEEIEYQKNLSQ
jgi:hypothetical protein